MIYTQALKNALIEAFKREAEYSNWGVVYTARNLANYDAVSMGPCSSRTASLST